MNLNQVWKDYAKAYAYFNAPSLIEVHKEVISRIIGQKIIDLGSGVGKLANLIPQDKNYQGIELNQAMLAEAKNRFKNFKNISFQKGNVCKLESESNTYTSATSVNVLYSLGSTENVNQALSEVYRILKPNGVFVVMGLNNNLDSKYLDQKIKEECQKQITDKHSEKLFQKFVECNQILGSQKQDGYTPQLFESEKLEEMLTKVGFKEQTKPTQENIFANCGYIISVKKS